MKKILISMTMIASGFVSMAQSTIAVGSVCPDITITDSKGTAHNLYTYCNQGKYVLVDFFAYWCGTCKQTAPYIEAFYKKYGCNSGDIIVLGNESDPGGTQANLNTFDSQAGLSADTYPAGFGTGGGSVKNSANAGLYGVPAYPTVVLIGPDKKMVNNDVWPISSVANIESSFPAGTINIKACAPLAISNVNIDIDNSFITPNPANSNAVLNIVLNNSIDLTYQIVDLSGKVIYQSNQVNTKKGENKINLPINNLSNGLYIVNVNAGSKKYASYKLSVN
jgi:thiol-disulfide isomerase/thioredoxin